MLAAQVSKHNSGYSTFSTKPILLGGGHDTQSNPDDTAEAHLRDPAVDAAMRQAKVITRSSAHTVPRETQMERQEPTSAMMTSSQLPTALGRQAPPLPPRQRDEDVALHDSRTRDVPAPQWNPRESLGDVLSDLNAALDGRLRHKAPIPTGVPSGSGTIASSVKSEVTTAPDTDIDINFALEKHLPSQELTRVVSNMERTQRATTNIKSRLAKLDASILAKERTAAEAY